MKHNQKLEIKSSKNYFNLKIFVSVAILAVFIFFAQSNFILITSLKNGEYSLGRYVFQEEDFSHPRLKLLRSREHLDEVVSSGKTQFDKIVLLRNWASKQWKAGSCFYYPPFDAVEILDLARKNKNYGFCAQYAVVFLQACQSLGIPCKVC